MISEYALKIYDANNIKPPNFSMVLVQGGCAYWDGENWHTLMERDSFRGWPVIQWKVKWWAELPKLQ